MFPKFLYLVRYTCLYHFYKIIKRGRNPEDITAGLPYQRAPIWAWKALLRISLNHELLRRGLTSPAVYLKVSQRAALYSPTSGQPGIKKSVPRRFRSLSKFGSLDKAVPFETVVSTLDRETCMATGG